MNNQNGAIAILAAIVMTALLGFAAISIDVGYLFASKNELQNAADAGALAGARELYTADGSGINTGCNEVAYNTAIQNLVAKDQIEIRGEGQDNNQDIQRGHWSFATRTFTQSDNTTVELWDQYDNIISKDVLDADLNFVNAVEVTVRRDTNPITLFFAKIFGQSDAKMSATAVAYIGFAGTFYPGEFDAPVALCEEYLGTASNYTCGVAVWYEQGETALWTTLNQDTNPSTGNCESGSTTAIRNVLDGNTDTIYAGVDLGVQDSVNSAVHMDFHSIWYNKSIVGGNEEHRKVVKMALPVVTCDSNTCAELVGGVTVDLLWYNIESAEADRYELAPYRYYEDDGTTLIFSSTETDDIARWNDFADELEIFDADGNPLPIENNQMYFRASCETSLLPTGGPGGENFGILSKIPVLVD